MIDINQDYWLFIESYVYTKKGSNDLFLYNTIDGQSITIDDEFTYNTISKLNEKENLGVIKVTREDLQDTVLKTFLVRLKEMFFVDLIPTNISNQKPIQFTPSVNLQTDVEKILNNEERDIGEDVLKYLNQISITINDNCNNSCKYCNQYYKLTGCCLKSDRPTEISFDLLELIFYQIENAPLGKININGGDLFNYSSLKKLIEKLIRYRDIVKFTHNYKNWNINRNGAELFLMFLNEIFITFPIDNSFDFYENSKYIDYIKYNFLIIDINEYSETIKIIKKYNIKNYKITPIYIGLNIDFFQKQIFLNKDDILNFKISLRKIFINQKMNSNFFGSLTLLNNGEVKASQNTKTLGNIKNNSILQCIQKELEENTVWRLVRNYSTCESCNYNFLCPPISNYEFVFDRVNLCNI